jgi:hypothetical protein
MPENEVDFKHKCMFCHKREATRLCDRVTGGYHFIGHPPVEGITHQKVFFTGKSEGIFTCDRLICDECSTYINGMDFCPKCRDEIKEFLLNK